MPRGASTRYRTSPAPRACTASFDRPPTAIDQKGTYYYNPCVSPSGCGSSADGDAAAPWSWASTTLTADKLVKMPNNEGCAVCHFVDKSWWPAPAASDLTGDGVINMADHCTNDPNNCGPAEKALGGGRLPEDDGHRLHQRRRCEHRRQQSGMEDCERQARSGKEGRVHQ